MLDVASALSMGMGVAPLFLMIVLFKGIKPKYHGLWFFGFLIICIAGLLAGGLSILEGNLSKNLADGNTKQALKDAQHTVTVWIYIGPAAIAAIGVNLITEFILRDKPEPDDSKK